jgi:hypothetical protein
VLRFDAVDGCAIAMFQDRSVNGDDEKHGMAMRFDMLRKRRVRWKEWREKTAWMNSQSEL